MRTLVLIDGQNLYHLARRAWASGPDSPYAWPSYDVEKLAHVLVSRTPARTLAEIRFYTGVPDPTAGSSQLFWHGFWSNKIRYLRSREVYVYRGRVNAGGQEKGVDVSLALDLVQATYDQSYEAAIIVSQDWDFGPAVRLAKEIARAQGRQLVFESCFPRRRAGRLRGRVRDCAPEAARFRPQGRSRTRRVPVPGAVLSRHAERSRVLAQRPVQRVGLQARWIPGASGSSLSDCGDDKDWRLEVKWSR